jgi:hypothetical protein
MAIDGDKKAKLLAEFKNGFGTKQQGFVKPKKQDLINEFQNFQKQKPISISELDKQFGQGETIEPLKEESKGIFQQLKEAFTGENLIDPKTEHLPEIGEVESDSKLKVLGTMLSAVNPQEQANILESNIEGLTQRQDNKGNIIVKFPNGNEAFVNKAGFSMSDFRNLASEAIQFFPAAKLAGLGKTFLKKIGLGAIGSGATQAIKEGVQSQIGGEFDTGEIATATAFSALGEAIPAGIKSFKQGRQAKLLGAEKDAIAETAETIAKADESSKATGVEFFSAQKTLNPSTLEDQAFVATLPSAQKISVAELKKQNKQVGDAVENLLKSIADPEVVQTGSFNFRTASEKAIEMQKSIRLEKSAFGKVVKEATEDGVEVDTKSVNNLIDDLINSAPNRNTPIDKQLKKVKKWFSEKKGNELNFKNVDNLRQLVGKIIQNPKLDESVKIPLREVREKIKSEMVKSYAPFDDAIKTFAKESIPVEQIERSVIGNISKVSDTQLSTISKKIFDPEQLNVSEVVKIKKIINSVDPKAFDNLLRVELERRLGSIKPEALSGAGLTVENLPDQLNRAIFGNQKQSAILKNSASPEQLKNLNYLQTALKRASLGRAGGSQTATRSEATERLKRGVITFLSNILAPAEGARKGLIASTFDKNVKKMAIALFDTKWQPQLSKIRKINPNTPEAARLWTQLLNNIENENEVK